MAPDNVSSKRPAFRPIPLSYSNTPMSHRLKTNDTHRNYNKHLRSYTVQQIGIDRSCVLHHLVQKTIFVVQQIMRMIEFDYFPVVQHEYAVRIHNRVQTMGDRQHRARSEFVPDGLLNQTVGPVRCLSDQRLNEQSELPITIPFFFFFFTGDRRLPWLRPSREFYCSAQQPWPSIPVAFGRR